MFTIIVSFAYAPHCLIELQKSQLRILEGHSTICFLWKFEPDILDSFRAVPIQKLKTPQRMIGSLALLPPSNYAWFDS